MSLSKTFSGKPDFQIKKPSYWDIILGRFTLVMFSSKEGSYFVATKHENRSDN